MAKFRANTDDAYILTNIQNQESGDSDWAKYQVVTKDKSRLFLHNNTTNSLLKVFKDTTQIHDIFGDGSAIATYTLDGNANDLSGNYNGIWNGTEQYSAGKFGQAAKFDGSSWIDATSIPESITASNWSWSCWVNLSDFNNQQICVNGRNLDADSSSNDRKNGCIAISNNEIHHVAKGSSDSNQIVKTVSVTNFLLLNTWYLFTYVLEGNIHKVYINGELISELTITTNGSVELVDGVGFELFRLHYSGTTHFYATGLRDQVRIFNRALTEDEVAFLYHEGLVHIRKHDQLIIYNATDGAKIHEITSITDNDTDKTYDIDISDLSLTEAPTNAHQLTKSVDLTDKIDTSNTTATTLVLQDALENPTLVKNGETLIIDGYKLENINVTRSLDGGNVKYNVDISSLNHVPSEVILIKPRVEISVDDEDKANADDLVLDVLDSSNTSITVGYYDGSKRARVKNAKKIDTDTGLDLPLIEVVEEYLDPTKVDPFDDNSAVATYTFDGNANDLGGNYNGTWSGTERYDTGVFGQAAKFDSSLTNALTTSYEFLSRTNNVTGTTKVSGYHTTTFSAWMKITGGTDLVLYNTGGKSNGYGIGIRNLQPYIAIQNNSTFQNHYVDFDIQVNTWYHLCFVFDESDCSTKVYVNGSYIETFVPTITVGDRDAIIRIGSINSGASSSTFYDDESAHYNNGLIDQVRIFNRALTEGEIKYLYNEGKYKFNLNLQSEQSSAPTKAIIRPTIQDILELDPNNTAYDNTNDLVNVYYQPIEKGNGFRSVQVKWNAHRQGDENNSLRVNLWKKVT